MQETLTQSLLAVMAQPSLAVLERVQSDLDVAATADALERAAAAAGAEVFARVDHAQLGDTEMILFADPYGAARPPLRALVYREADGSTWLAYDAIAKGAAGDPRGQEIDAEMPPRRLSA